MSMAPSSSIVKLSSAHITHETDFYCPSLWAPNEHREDAAQIAGINQSISHKHRSSQSVSEGSTILPSLSLSPRISEESQVELSAILADRCDGAIPAANEEAACITASCMCDVNNVMSLCGAQPFCFSCALARACVTEHAMVLGTAGASAANLGVHTHASLLRQLCGMCLAAVRDCNEGVLKCSMLGRTSVELQGCNLF